ncbi:alkaline phosphatase [bacterium]|nr:alkaline phosphatase [bacterium]
MKHSKTTLLLSALVLLAASFISCTNKNTSPKNIIFLIGDGMGVAHITAALTTGGSLNLERMPVGGLITTYSSNEYVTDSAAGGTALACGEKTNNGMVGMRPDTTAMESVLDVAESMNWATGLVATCKITHATPASFDANVPSRNNYNDIAKQMADTKAEVLFGGGIENFVPSRVPGSRRKDELDLLAKLAETHQVVTTAEGFNALATPLRAVALLDSGHIATSDKREISLSAMSTKALDILSQDKDGFFLMIEGSQIDWECHDNNSEGTIRETLDFDDAVGVIMDWAEQHPGTLVIVTADHETGGYSLLDGSVADKTITKTHYSTGNHSGVMVPILAYGPGAELFGGIHDNTHVGKTLKCLILE